MTSELLIRFALGGAIVSAFAIVGELFEPKTFAGIFGAAPSVALASLTLTAFKEGNGAVAAQAGAMVFGAIALFVYSVVLAVVVRRWRFPAWLEAGMAWSVWFAIALPIWAGVLR